MNGYIGVGVLPEEDVDPVKLCSEEQSIFKVYVVVPERTVLEVCWLLLTPGAVEEEETVIPDSACSRDQRCCHITFPVIFWPELNCLLQSTLE